MHPLVSIFVCKAIFIRVSAAYSGSYVEKIVQIFFMFFDHFLSPVFLYCFLFGKSVSKINQRQKKILSTVCLYHGLNDASVAVIPLLIPIFRVQFDLSYTQIGIVTGSALAINLVAQLLIGRRSEYWNPRWALSFGIFLMAIGLFLLSTSFDFLSLVAFMIIARLAASFFHPIGVGWISKTFRKSRLDWAMGVQSGFADIGACIAMASTLFLASVWFWQLPLYLFAGFCFFGVIVGVLTTRGVVEENIKKEKNQTSLKHFFGEDIEFLSRVKLLIPAFIISGAGWNVTITYLPLLFDEKTALSLSVIGLLMAVWVGMGSIVSFYFGRITDTFGRWKVMVGAYLLFGVACFVVTLTGTLVALLAIMVLLGISIFLTYPALFSYVTELSAGKQRRDFAMVFTLQLGGGTILAFVSGWLADLLGIQMPFVLMGTLSLSLFVLLACNHRWLKNKIIEVNAAS